MNTLLSTIIQQQKNFFSTHTTHPIEFRKKQLIKLKKAIIDHEQIIIDALYADLKKPPFESYATEITCVIDEINYALNNIDTWHLPHNKIRTVPLFPGYGYTQAQPLGIVLIISPWNYPFQLNCIPLVGAIAAGNCIIIKPSEHAPQTAALLAMLTAQLFDPAHVHVIQGTSETAQALLLHKFDYIFFTGSSHVGRIVMQHAAHHLTPITLELGGKNPCIVDRDADLDCAAKRIVWGKFLNAGQSCVAPDYLLVHESIQKIFTEKLSYWITQLYGSNPQKSPDYGRIINQTHYDRLSSLLKQEKIITGGQIDRDTLYIAPTIIESYSLDTPIMQEEIFGPILPIIQFNTINQALEIILRKPKPLALYLFSHNKKIQQQITQQTYSGSLCINDLIIQASSPKLPFGGVGLSGIGSYHGKKSFDTFSHYKTIVKNSCSFDIGLRYPPYNTRLKRIIKTVLNWLNGV